MSATDHWLDTLARRMTRRTALRAGLATALVAGPLRALTVAPAGAVTSTRQCLAAGLQKAQDTFSGCVDGPLKRLDAARTALQAAENRLLFAHKPKNRQKWLKEVDVQSKRARDAIETIEDCNADWLDARDYTYRSCSEQAREPATTPTGPIAPGGPPKCDPQAEVQCGNICCNATGHPICCFCQSTGLNQCCSQISTCAMCCGEH